MSRTLLTIRHAPTKDNTEGVFMGRTDSLCTSEGLMAACTLAGALKVTTTDYVYTSPLRRCVATVAALFPGRPARTDIRLAERDLGSWAGRSKGELPADVPSAFLFTGGLSPHYTPPGGESLPVFSQRVATFLMDVCAVGSDSSTIVAVTHNGVIRLMRHLLEGLVIECAFAEAEPHLVARAFVLDHEVLQMVKVRVAALSTWEDSGAEL